MSDERWVTLTDPNGAQTDVDVTVERFALLMDSISPADEEHVVVSLEDNEAWYLEYTPGSLTFGNAESHDDRPTLVGLGRDEVLALAAEFIEGDFDAIRARPWATR